LFCVLARAAPACAKQGPSIHALFQAVLAGKAHQYWGIGIEGFLKFLM
jgi:hypothetical protein